VPIPDELRESLREVRTLIREAKRDPSISLSHGDAIQIGVVCGGRYGKKNRPYVLTYFPGNDCGRKRWFLTLHRTEINDIADGTMNELFMYCCTSSDCQCKFRECDEYCFYCDYIDDPNFGTFSFPQALEKLAQRGIQGVTAAPKREDVVALLGEPDEAGGGIEQSLRRHIPVWVKYHRVDCQLHFEFFRSGEIKHVTVMEKNWKPGL